MCLLPLILSGKGGRRKKFKLAVPICTRDEGPRMSNGAPPANYIQQLVPVVDWSKFNRDSQPKHPVFDDSYWLKFFLPKQPSRETHYDLDVLLAGI